MAEVMWDLQGTQFDKGVLELRLEKQFTGILKLPLRVVLALGPIRGRLLAISILLLGAYLNYLRQPFAWMLDSGYLVDQRQAAGYVSLLTWVFVGTAVLIYIGVFFVRQERLELEFDRHNKLLKWYLLPLGARFSAKEGEFPFSMIREIRVHAASSKHSAPHGFLEISFKDLVKPPFKVLKLRFLSDEQKKIYPLNLYRLTDVKPVGDWSDPDDELHSAAAQAKQGSEDLSQKFNNQNLTDNLN